MIPKSCRCFDCLFHFHSCALQCLPPHYVLEASETLADRGSKARRLINPWPQPQAETHQFPLSSALPLTPTYFTFKMISSSPPLFGIHPAMTIRSLIQSYFIVLPFPYPMTCSPPASSFMNNGLCALFIRITFRFLFVGLINSPLVHISSI